MTRRTLITTALAASALAATSHAATPVVFTNTSNLLPNTANQTLQIFVQGTDLISGENLNFQINGATSGPTLTGMDIISGTIFASNNLPPTGPGITNSGTTSGRLAIISVATNSGTVLDNGLLATLSISTGPSSGGVFTLNMIDTSNGASEFDLPSPSNTNNLNAIAIAFPHNQFSIGTPDRQWAVNGGGVWETNTTTSNWTPFAPYAQGDIANFLGALTSGTAVITLDSDRTMGVVNFNNAAGSYNIAAGTGGTLRLNNGASSPLISDSAGAHQISAPIFLSAGTNVSVSNGATLTLSGNISGSQLLSLTGTGTLVLTGMANAYGATNVAAGSNLIVGGGTSSGSVGSGPITNNGHVTFAGTTYLLASPLSGSGNTTVTGSIQLANTDSSPVTDITSTGILTVIDPGGLLAGGSVTNAGSLVFNRTGAISHSAIISGAGTLTQAGSGTTTLTGGYSATGPIKVNAGRLTFGNTGSARQTSAVLVESSALTVGGGSTLDLANRDMMIHTGSTAAYEAKIGAAYDFSSWDLPGITSSTAGASSGSTSLGIMSGADYNNISPNSGVFDGKPVSSTDTLIKYTYAGDINLDGLVNIDDLSQFLTAYFGDQTGNYAMGDINFDGLVNIDDLSLFLTNYFINPTQPLSSDAQPGLAGASTNVPEPATLLILAAGAWGILSRRRRVIIRE